jgi:putative ABC transport system permease protein
MKNSGTRLIFKMAWRNLWRQRRRTLITLFSMAAGLAFAIPTYGLMEGLNRQMINGITGMHIGNIQVHEKRYPQERKMGQILDSRQVQKSIKNVPGVLAVAPRAYSGGMVSAEKVFKSLIKGIDYKEFKKIPLLSGRIPIRTEKCVAIMDKTRAEALKIRAGSILLFRPMPPEGACEHIKITGIYDKIDGDPIIISKQDSLKIFAKVTQPSKSTDNDDDSFEDDDDIDNLKKLDDISANDPIKKDVLVTKAVSGSWNIVKLYSQPVGIIAISPKDEKEVSTLVKGIVKGKYLSEKYVPNKGRQKVFTEILIGEKLAKILLVKVGDVIGMDMGTIHNYALDRFYKVVGVFKTGLSDFDRGLVYIHIANAWDSELMGLLVKKDNKTSGGAHEFAIRIKKGENSIRIASDIREIAGKNAIVRRWQQIEPSMAGIVNTQKAMTGLLLAIILMIASFGTMNTMLMSVMERIKEFGVLKSIGMKPTSVATLILMEATFLIIVATLLGVASGLGLQQLLITHGIDMTSIMPNGFSFQGVIIEPVWRAAFSMDGIFIPVTLLCSISVVVAIWPAIRAARIKPVEAFRDHG